MASEAFALQAGGRHDGAVRPGVMLPSMVVARARNRSARVAHGLNRFYSRSSADGRSVNAACRDGADGLDLRVGVFERQNWEANALALAELSRDPA